MANPLMIKYFIVAVVSTKNLTEMKMRSKNHLMKLATQKMVITINLIYHILHSGKNILSTTNLQKFDFLKYKRY